MTAEQVNDLLYETDPQSAAGMSIKQWIADLVNREISLAREQETEKLLAVIDAEVARAVAAERKFYEGLIGKIPCEWTMRIDMESAIRARKDQPT